MKRSSIIILTIILLLVFGLFALGSSSEEANPSTSSEQPANGESTPSTEPPTEEITEAPTEDITLGDYTVEVKGFRLVTDYERKPVIIITYTFTNVSDDDAASFIYSIEDNVYQNGISLNSAYLLNDNANYSSDNQMKELKMGASLDIEVAYELNDTTTDVEVELKEWMSFNDEVLITILKIA